eukprot:scaffold45375_cov51-Phaeocystis_antarctica.AAC.1
MARLHSAGMAASPRSQCAWKRVRTWLGVRVRVRARVRARVREEGAHVCEAKADAARDGLRRVAAEGYRVLVVCHVEQQRELGLGLELGLGVGVGVRVWVRVGVRVRVRGRVGVRARVTLTLTLASSGLRQVLALIDKQPVQRRVLRRLGT